MYNEASYIKAKTRAYKTQIPERLSATVPGIPLFEEGHPNPDLFFQGEDVVYEAYLYHEDGPVLAEDYEISVVVKTSPRASLVSWEGKLDLGVEQKPNQSGNYEIWIPAAVTEKFLAGTYYLDVMITERVGKGLGKHDRKYVLLQTVFNIDYSNHSPAPESRTSGKDLRTAVEGVWPNAVNTIGARTVTPDSFHSGD
jgi:hypothetical protein